MFESVLQQQRVQSQCQACLSLAHPVKLHTTRHISFLKRGLERLSSSYVSLDAARPWIIYWCLNGLALLPDGKSEIETMAKAALQTLRTCQHPDGGFGGGPGQLAHLATTYAVVLSIAIIGLSEGYDLIDRTKLYRWLMALKVTDGGFRIHHGGEVDARAAYLALSVSCLLNLLTSELTEGTARWLVQCQRPEGGMSGIHGAEAHAGLSFCALATLHILHDPDQLVEKVDPESLLYWMVQRQLPVEGGFSGRTNKLVDGCYSWWAGAEFPLVEALLGITDSLYDRESLTKYLLHCCQLEKYGGMRDKPGKSPDYYHTCYCLAGLSSAQRQYTYETARAVDIHPGYHNFSWTSTLCEENKGVILTDIHPIFAIPEESAKQIRAWAILQHVPASLELTN